MQDDDKLCLQPYFTPLIKMEWSKIAAQLFVGDLISSDTDKQSFVKRGQTVLNGSNVG